MSSNITCTSTGSVGEFAAVVLAAHAKAIGLDISDFHDIVVWYDDDDWTGTESVRWVGGAKSDVEQATLAAHVAMIMREVFGNAVISTETRNETPKRPIPGQILLDT